MTPEPGMQRLVLQVLALQVLVLLQPHGRRHFCHAMPGGCFKYRGWSNPCANVTCPDNAECLPALNVPQRHKCSCISHCWDVGDSEDSGQVCGSDGVTYASLCHLRRASCHAAVRVTPRFKGQCDPCASAGSSSSSWLDGHRCPEGQRCVFDADSRRPSCACAECIPGPASRHPVCASNGKTYSNECHMRRESCLHSLGLTKLADAACPVGKYCQSPCPHQFMECRVVDPASGQSACRCPGPCPQILSPVCGTDNVTYDSLCHLRRAACLSGAQVQELPLLPLHLGVCSLPAEACTRHQRRLCPYGGVCRSAIVELSSRSFSLSLTCKRPECLWPESTTAVGAVSIGDRAMLRAMLASVGGEPRLMVCGTDGVTYASECHLRQTAFDNSRRTLRVRHRGSCDSCRDYRCPYYGVCRMSTSGAPECHCQISCMWEPSPVCGSDGVTYAMECDLQLQACTRQEEIRVVSRGKCKHLGGTVFLA